MNAIASLNPNPLTVFPIQSALEIQTLRQQIADLEERLELYRRRDELEASVSNEKFKDHCMAVISAVAEEFHLPARALFDPGRHGRVSEPRHVAMALLYEHSNYSASEVSRVFGRKDHGTVLWAHKRVSELCEIDSRYKGRVDKLRKLVAESVNKPAAS